MSKRLATFTDSLSSFPLVNEGNGGWIPALARTSYKRQRNPNRERETKKRKRHTKMIKTRTGAQRYNARMSKLFEEAVRLKKHYESITVVIDVRGGVAEVVSKPENINVVIRDWDNIGA
jgi:actin-related protein